jgi:uncharacterized FAD-dependent dehydrogenase
MNGIQMMLKSMIPGFDPDVLGKIIPALQQAIQVVNTFDARLTAIESRLSRVESKLDDLLETKKEIAACAGGLAEVITNGNGKSGVDGNPASGGCTSGSGDRSADGGNRS